MSQPKFTGIWIPSAVFNNKNLSTSAKLLYGVVAGLDGDDGCYASNAYLQRLLGVSERGVQALLSELDAIGIIQRAEVEGRRIIRTVESIALGGAEICGGGMKKSAGEGCRKLHPYNKVDNKEEKIQGGRVSKTPDFMLTQQPTHMGVPAFAAAWVRWAEYAYPKKKVPYMTYVGQVDFLNKMTPEEAVECIEQSIRNGWKGLFPSRKSKHQTKALTKDDHEQF